MVNEFDEFGIWLTAFVLAVAGYAVYLHGVMDEILTLAMFCGPKCVYPFPFLPPVSLYDAEIVVDAVLDFCVAVAFLSLFKMVKLWGRIFGN